MIGNFLKRMFGGAGGTAEPEIAARESYQGFELLAIPREDPNGWRVAGSIVTEAEGQEQRYDFVRADTCPGRDTAAQASLQKARQIVDEQGLKLFRS